MVFEVPADAVVYLSNTKMKTQGTTRRYKIPVPQIGKTYKYPVRVEVSRDGTKLTSESVQSVTAGQTLNVVVRENADSGLKTALLD